MARSCVFLDRDGVLNLDTGYTYKTADLKLVPGMIEGLKKLHAAGFSFVVITNQGGIAKGLYTIAETEQFHASLAAKIAVLAPGVQFLDFMICPHHPEGKIPELTGPCECRKPKTKLVDDAVAKHDIDKSKSWFIGDKVSDVDCGMRAGLRSIQVTKGGKQYPHHPGAVARVDTLKEAADIILSELSSSQVRP